MYNNRRLLCLKCEEFIPFRTKNKINEYHSNFPFLYDSPVLTAPMSQCADYEALHVFRVQTLVDIILIRAQVDVERKSRSRGIAGHLNCGQVSANLEILFPRQCRKVTSPGDKTSPGK